MWLLATVCYIRFPVFFFLNEYSSLSFNVAEFCMNRTLLGTGQIGRIFFQVFYVNRNMIMLAMLSFKKKNTNNKMCNLRRHELLLHPLTLYFVGFLTLHVFWEHLVLRSWKPLASMQRLSDLHSSRTAAFPNPALAFPCPPSSSAAWHHAGTSGRGKGPGSPREREEQQQSLLKETIDMGGECETLAWQAVGAGGLSVGCCVGGF